MLGKRFKAQTVTITAHQEDLTKSRLNPCCHEIVFYFPLQLRKHSPHQHCCDDRYNFGELHNFKHIQLQLVIYLCCPDFIHSPVFLFIVFPIQYVLTEQF